MAQKRYLRVIAWPTSGDRHSHTPNDRFEQFDLLGPQARIRGGLTDSFRAREFPPQRRQAFGLKGEEDPARALCRVAGSNLDYRRSVHPFSLTASLIVRRRLFLRLIPAPQRPICLENPMIKLTHLSHEGFVLNSDLIEYLESLPDTVITLTTGQKLRVSESADEIIARVVEFKRSVFSRLCQCPTAAKDVTNG